jgi:hypothetical protein
MEHSTKLPRADHRPSRINELPVTLMFPRTKLNSSFQLIAVAPASTRLKGRRRTEALMLDVP